MPHGLAVMCGFPHTKMLHCNILPCEAPIYPQWVHIVHLDMHGCVFSLTFFVDFKTDGQQRWQNFMPNRTLAASPALGQLAKTEAVCAQ